MLRIKFWDFVRGRWPSIKQHPEAWLSKSIKFPKKVDSPRVIPFISDVHFFGQITGGLIPILSLRSSHVTIVQSTRETGDITDNYSFTQMTFRSSQRYCCNLISQKWVYWCCKSAKLMDENPINCSTFSFKEYIQEPVESTYNTNSKNC